MLLIIPPDLLKDNLSASALNSCEKAYNEDPDFHIKGNQLSVKMIYEYQYQKKEHIQLMNILESVLKEYHKFLFHIFMSNNTLVNALKEKAHEMLGHHPLIHLLIHMSPQTIKDAYKFVNGVPNLSNFDS